MMTQLQPGVQQHLPTASSHIFINTTNSVNAAVPSLPNTPYHPPGIPYHIYQNVVLAAVNGTSGGLKNNELQTVVPTIAAPTTTTTISTPIIKTELPPVASVLKTDITCNEFGSPNITQQLSNTTNIKSEFGFDPSS